MIITMKKGFSRYYFFLFASFLLLGCMGEGNEQGTAKDLYKDLKENFKNPDSYYGVNCWWWWLNSNVTKEAITRDLEQMKAKGFSGALICDADVAALHLPALQAALAGAAERIAVYRVPPEP